MEARKWMSMTFEEAIEGEAPLLVSSTCAALPGTAYQQRVLKKQAASVFREHGPAVRYVMILPVTRISQPEGFRAEIKTAVSSAGLETNPPDIVFKHPHDCLKLKPPAVVLQAAFTPDTEEIFIAGSAYGSSETVADMESSTRSISSRTSDAFVFVSRPHSAEADTVSTAFEFVQKHLRNAAPGFQVILVGEGEGLRIMTQLKRLIEGVADTKTEIWQNFDLLKGALATQEENRPNPSRTADVHLRTVDAALARKSLQDFREASVAIASAKAANPHHPIVLKKKVNFHNVLYAAATEGSLEFQKFAASVLTEPNQLTGVWQLISNAPLHPLKKEAAVVAAFFEKMGGR